MTHNYRSLKAGAVATKASLDDRELLSVVKSANESVSSSTVDQADNELTLPVAANAIYHVSCAFIVSGPTGGDWKYTWAFPAGATGQQFGHGPAVAVTTVRATEIHARSSPIATSLGYGTDGSENSAIREELFISTSTTAGNLTLTWAQQVATVGATTVLAGSWITAYRVV